MNKLMCFMVIVLMTILTGCVGYTPSSDQQQQAQQEAITQEGTQAVGMPNIKNFQERRLMKTILEKRDDAKLHTYAYTFNEMDGKFRFMGDTMGFGLPGATEFTSPEKVDRTCGVSRYSGNSWWCYDGTSPQADPNGLFMPASEDATWILMVNPADPNDLEPIYMEPHVTISPFKLPASIVDSN
jgi:hypothetical protein